MPKVGFLMLDTRFPRVVGDAGCAQTWGFAVDYFVVPRSFPRRVVCSDDASYLLDFIRGGLALTRLGADGIATTCGFLCLHQQALSDALPVPVMTSSLLMGADLQCGLPTGKKLGILSASPDDLSDSHLTAAAINPQDAIVGGLAADSYFADVLLNNRDSLDVDRAREDMRAAAAALCRRGDIGVILLECANMPPYAEAVADVTGLSVFSIIDAVNQFHQSL